MNQPILSSYYSAKKPSVIRQAQIDFAKRTDNVQAINLAIGNVSLPMHPAMIERLFNLDQPKSPFHQGVVQYSATIGLEETRQAFLRSLQASGCSTEQLFCQITDGGSQAMELVILGVCGPAGTSQSPLMLIEAAYTNYVSMAERTGRSTVNICRTLNPDGQFTLPDLAEIESTIKQDKPSALLVIPYDNPTGHFYDHDLLIELARLCVKYNLWFVSDEAYRELQYTDKPASSIWSISEEEVPGITGRRISIESASKVWNACGLRIGAVITDNQQFHEKCVAENTTNLCPNVIGQYVYGAIAQQSISQLQQWFASQRQYYQKLMTTFTQDLKSQLPQIIISKPDATIYSVIDVRQMVDENFNANQFVAFCAQQGSISIDNQNYTLLLSPMSGFYSNQQNNPGRTQMRVAYVETPEKLSLAPALFTSLLKQYISN